MHGRTFDGTDDLINFAATNWNQLTGSFSVAAIFYRNAVGAKHVLMAGIGTTTSDNSLNINASNQVVWYQNGTSRTSTTTIAATGLYLVALNKASGTATARVHIYNYQTGVWVHENLSGTTPNMGGASTALRYGDDGKTGGFFNGDIIMAGGWNGSLSDFEYESLALYAGNWQRISTITRWVHMFDQRDVSTAVTNLVGSAAQTSVTGTAVGSVDAPIWWKQGVSTEHSVFTLPYITPLAGSWGFDAQITP